jgi:hypothetical protein
MARRQFLVQSPGLALLSWGAKFGNPTVFVGLVEWADRIITE